MEILYFIIGLMAGAVISGLITRAIITKGADSRVMQERQRNEDEARRYERELQRRDEEERRRRAEDEARQRAHTETLQQKQALEFRAIVDELVSMRKDALRDENRRQITEILSPLQSDIEEFRKSVTRYYENEARDKTALIREVELLSKAGKEVGEEARRLTHALTGSTSAQGKWGEILLETILTKAGLVKGRDFHTQFGSDENGALKDDNNRGQRPDVVIDLPDDHKVVVDSKVSLTSFATLEESDSTIARDEALKKHLASVKKHVDELSKKQYHKNIAGAMEHTLMFIPNDAAYIAAITADSTLWEYAYARHVVIVSSTHILSVLQMTRQLWRVENQNRNAEQIARLGGLIYDKMAAFLADFESVRTSAQKTLEAWSKCEAHINNERTGIRARALRLQELGSKTTRRIPDIS